MGMHRPKWIDVTREIRPGISVYAGDPSPQIETTLDRSGISVTRIVMLTHTGTHLDLPPHVDLRMPRPSTEQIVRALNGRTVVLRLGRSGDAAISLNRLHRAFRGRPPRRLLIRSDPTREGYRGLAPEAARWLAGRAYLVGTDAVSIDPPGMHLDAHRILLGSGTLVIENLLLAKIPPGLYHLMALPLRLDAPDGAPVRALMRRARESSMGERS